MRGETAAARSHGDRAVSRVAQTRRRPPDAHRLARCASLNQLPPLPTFRVAPASAAGIRQHSLLARPRFGVRITAAQATDAVRRESSRWLAGALHGPSAVHDGWQVRGERTQTEIATRPATLSCKSSRLIQGSSAKHVVNQSSRTPLTRALLASTAGRPSSLRAPRQRPSPVRPCQARSTAQPSSAPALRDVPPA